MREGVAGEGEVLFRSRGTGVFLLFGMGGGSSQTKRGFAGLTKNRGLAQVGGEPFWAVGVTP